jgi:hypothetical protein
MARRGGPKEALDILGGIWCSQNFRNAKSAFRGDMGYVAYNNIVDRFRWKDGCITEHVSNPKSGFGASILTGVVGLWREMALVGELGWDWHHQEFVISQSEAATVDL